MERLEGFVPEALLKRLQHPARAEAGGAAPFRGAVLFVDISGYTSLAENLCSKGANGVEQLGRILNLAFRSHVRAVRSTAGEIACFAGDAFIAYWPADDGNVARALGRARDCALLLHEASRVESAMMSTPQPALHIGMSAGDLWAARLGSKDYWHLLLAGPAVRQACAASGRATAGATVVAPEAGPFVATANVPASESSAAGDSTRADVFDPVGHVPKRVQEYAGEGYSDWIPQRRTICALFIRIDGLDDRAPDAFARHQAAVTSLQLALRPFTGSNGALLLDDKGLVFTLCLGMPHDTHVDDALRAVRGGLAVRGELARLGLSSSIGIAAGPGVCMPLGGPERRHYWPVGRFMHVAGRLMEAAGGGLLCTEEVADRVRRSVSLSPERPLALKGLRWRLRPFRIHEAAVVDEPHGVLYGREDEQAALDQCLNDFENGQGTVLWMVGEAGLGKSALVHYLQHAAATRQIKCIAGGAGSVEMAVPYVAWRAVFVPLLGDAKPSEALPEAQRLARLGNVRHPQLAPLINAVVPGFLEETAIAQSLAGQARADATCSLLSEVLGAHLGPRFVLILEDCHWMDSASWRLVLRVAQDYPQALVVLTARPGIATQELDGLKGLDRFTEIQLARLRPAAIASLVESLLGSDGNHELVEEITASAVGHPLFAREYALLRATQPTARDDEAHTDSAESDEPRVPVTIQSLIAGRFDALSPSEDLTLKAASVIGDRFGRDLLAAIYPGGQQTSLESALKGLSEHQLIVRDSTDGSLFAFQHAMIRQVAYAQLTREQRMGLHRRLAGALEQWYSEDLRPHYASLAHHWSQAEVPEATINYSDMAASQALAAGAFEEAERLLSACINLATGEHAAKTATRIRWHRQVADARHGMGQLEPRRAAAHRALRLAGHLRSQNAATVVALTAARLCGMGLRRVAPAAFQNADAPQVMDVAQAYRHSAAVCYFNNDLLRMICDSISAVAFASRVPPSAVLSEALIELGGILSIAGFRRLGEGILKRAVTMAEAAGDHTAQAYAQLVSSLYYVGRAEWKSAEASARRCQALCEPMDDRVNWNNAQTVRFWMSHHRCHHGDAYDAACRLRDRANETGNRQHRAWALRCLAVCSLRQEDAGASATYLQSAIECLGETAALNERIPTLGLLSLVQLKNGQVWSARATAKEALAQIVRIRRPIGHGTLEGYSSLAAVCVDAWREERSLEWRRAARECLRLLQRYQRSFPVGKPRYQLHLGDVYRLSGATSAASRSYRRGETEASRLGMPWEAARCREGLAALSSS